MNVEESALAAALTCVDEFIVDIKSMDADIYRRYTGKDNRLVLRNLETLARCVPPVNVKLRVPLIPRYNDAADQQNSKARLQQLGFTRIERFDYIIK